MRGADTAAVLADLDHMKAAVLALYDQVAALRAQVAIAQQAPPPAPERELVDNPVAAWRSSLGMSRTQFSVHTGMTVEAIKDAERGHPTKLAGRWADAIVIGGFRYDHFARQYVTWRQQLVTAGQVGGSVTQIARRA